MNVIVILGSRQTRNPRDLARSGCSVEVWSNASSQCFYEGLKEHACGIDRQYNFFHPALCQAVPFTFGQGIERILASRPKMDNPAGVGARRVGKERRVIRLP